MNLFPLFAAMFAWVEDQFPTPVKDTAEAIGKVAEAVIQMSVSGERSTVAICWTIGWTAGVTGLLIAVVYPVVNVLLERFKRT